MDMEKENREFKERKEAKKLEMEKKADMNRGLKWERTRRGLSSPRIGKGESGEKSVELAMVKNLQLIPEFDEQKLAKWFNRFEKTMKFA